MLYEEVRIIKYFGERSFDWANRKITNSWIPGGRGQRRGLNRGVRGGEGMLCISWWLG